MPNSDGTLAVRVVFENSGVTPALNLAAECYTVVTEGDTVTEDDFPLESSLKPATSNLAPHHQGSCLVGLKGAAGWRPSDLMRGRLVAGVRTYISYRDEFKQLHKLVFTASAGGRAGVSEDGRMSVIGDSNDYIVP